MTDMTMRPDPLIADTGSGGPGRHEQEVARLAELHTRLIDTVEGHDKIAEKAQPEFVAIAEEFRDLHRDQAQRVASMLAGLGHDPGRDGSVFGTVNRAVVEVRSWFDDIGHNVLDAVRQGEKHVHDAYEEAIAASPSIARRATLEAMRQDLVQLVQRHAPPQG